MSTSGSMATKRWYSTGVPWNSAPSPGALVGAVGDEDVGRARAAQVARRQLRHLARAASMTVRLSSDPKNLARQLHGA